MRTHVQSDFKRGKQTTLNSEWEKHRMKKYEEIQHVEHTLPAEITFDRDSEYVSLMWTISFIRHTWSESQYWEESVSFCLLIQLRYLLLAVKVITSFIANAAATRNTSKKRKIIIFNNYIALLLLSRNKRIRKTKRKHVDSVLQTRLRLYLWLWKW